MVQYLTMETVGIGELSTIKYSLSYERITGLLYQLNAERNCLYGPHMKTSYGNNLLNLIYFRMSTLTVNKWLRLIDLESGQILYDLSQKSFNSWKNNLPLITSSPQHHTTSYFLILVMHIKKPYRHLQTHTLPVYMYSTFRWNAHRIIL